VAQRTLVGVVAARLEAADQLLWIETPGQVAYSGRPVGR
jgi:hypothetical protein